MTERGNLFRQMSRSGLSLFVFAVIGIGVVTLFHILTVDRIEKNEREYMLRSLNELIPASTYDNDLFTDTIDVIDPEMLGTDQAVVVFRARRQDQPVGLIISPQAPNGYNGVIRLLVGIYADGGLAGVRVVSHRETPGLGDGIDQQRSDWIEQFPGLSLVNTKAADWQVKKDDGRFDQLTGATISPRVVVQAVHKTMLFFDQHQTQLFDSATGETYRLQTEETPEVRP